MAFPALIANDFSLIGAELMGRDSSHGSALTFDRRFRSTFGTSPDVCAVIWNMLDPYNTIAHEGTSPQHLLWALMFMKMYAKESVRCSMAGGVDEKTLRKWVWIFVIEISFLEPYVVCAPT
jgi:hypothetical protein